MRYYRRTDDPLSVQDHSLNSGNRRCPSSIKALHSRDHGVCRASVCVLTTCCSLERDKVTLRTSDAFRRIDVSTFEPSSKMELGTRESDVYAEHSTRDSAESRRLGRDGMHSRVSNYSQLQFPHAPIWQDTVQYM